MRAPDEKQRSNKVHPKLTLGSGLVLAAITCLGRPHMSWEFVLLLTEPRWTG